jgi:3-isopropylmalate dehydrogenase
MKARIAVLGGDGIGPEVVAEALRCLDAVSKTFGHEFTLSSQPFGGAAIDTSGDPLPPGTLQACLEADAVLLGAIGGPKWSAPSAKVRPEQGLLRLRKELGVYANLRPVKLHASLIGSSTIKPEVLEGVDLVFVRELTGGIYFGEKKRDANSAVDVCTYTVGEVERIIRVAARLARQRRRKLTSIDKSNVLETSRLWREVTTRVMQSEFPDVSVEHVLVDAAAMHLIKRPRDFDVLVTENMFGDILTDEASMLSGSLGLLPSASLGDGRRGVYEPIHGSAPDIAGRGIANPIGTIMSLAMLLRHSLQLTSEADALEAAVGRALAGGARTPDIAGPGEKALSTREAGDAIVYWLKSPAAISADITS